MKKETNKTGSFTNGRLYGYAEIRFKNGSNFIGNFKAGKISGNGRFTYTDLKDESGVPEEGTYEGQFKYGRRHGLGKMEWRDNSRFEGTWSNDKRHHGKMTLSDGSVYTGYFKNDVFHGKGQLKLSNSRIFEAEFVNGFAPKFGKMTFGDSGDVYEGNFEDFRMQGHGIMQYGNGDIYDGSWENNLRHGFGSIKYANQNMYIGKWEYDKRSGNGREVIEEDKLYFEATYSNNLRNGSAHCIDFNGKVTFGDWRNNKKEGIHKTVKEGDPSLYEDKVKWIKNILSSKSIKAFIRIQQ